MLLVTVVPFGLVAVGYVLVGAVRPGLFDGPWGKVTALLRISVKLLTMTLLLVRAVRWSAVPQCAAAAGTDLCRGQAPG